MTSKVRCFGNKPNQETYAQYHDNEWGQPQHNDLRLFEMLTLEGAQAGLSWETILKKRQGYRDSFYDFDVIKVANMSDDDLDLLKLNPNIIRNRLKIYSTRKNAISFINIQKEFGSFDHYIWGFVNHSPICNSWVSPSDVPASTPLSEAI